MKLSRRVRRLESAEEARGGSCRCGRCDVLQPDPPYSDRYPEHSPTVCPDCRRTVPCIVLRYVQAPLPRNDGHAASSR